MSDGTNGSPHERQRATNGSRRRHDGDIDAEVDAQIDAEIAARGDRGGAGRGAHRASRRRRRLRASVVGRSRHAGREVRGLPRARRRASSARCDPSGMRIYAVPAGVGRRA